jgi:hypothetical protein
MCTVLHLELVGWLVRNARNARGLGQHCFLGVTFRSTARHKGTIFIMKLNFHFWRIPSLAGGNLSGKSKSILNSRSNFAQSTSLHTQVPNKL